MATGTVKWFNDAKGYGFISPEGGGKDLFVHHSSIVGEGYRSLAEGARVEYEPREGQKGPEATNVAELGIGTNEEAILTGNILEDEKIFGTAHVAFGASAGIGGTIQVPVHLDVVIKEPTVEIDGEAILGGGELLI